MKKFIPFLLVMFFGAAALLTGCTEDPPEAEPLPQAIVTGKVQVNTDLTQTTLSNVPVGTKIFFYINAADLVLEPLPGYTYQTIRKEAMVDSNGKYRIDLDCSRHKVVTVSIVPDEYSGQRKLDAVTLKADYYYTPVTPAPSVDNPNGYIQIGIREGETHYLDILYN